MTTFSESRTDVFLPPAPRGRGWAASVRHMGPSLGLAWSARGFAQALRHPQRIQERILRQLLAHNAQTDYGRAHGFKTILSLAAFQAKVPIVDYETVKPWIAQIADGAAGVLVSEPVLALRRSAGYSGVPKLLPETAGLLQQMGAALRPWLHDMLRQQPDLWKQQLYWELLPARRGPTQTRGKLPFATPSVARVIGGLAGDLVQQRLAVPLEVGAMANESRWRRTSLYDLLACDDLGAMFLSNPANLLDLMHGLQEDLPDLLARLPAARAEDIRRGLDRQGRLNSAALWPKLRVVTLWRDGPAVPFLPHVSEFFPGVSVKSSPLRTQEAILTVPMWDVAQGAPLAIASHFFEFADAQDERRPPLLPHALRPGGVYLPIISTAGGLYRYRLPDAVRCVGHRGQTPLLSYVEKAGPASNMCGERLSPERIECALEEACQSLGLRYDFALCAPLPRPQQGYCLYMETRVPDHVLAQAAEMIEQALCRHYPYWYCRRGGQLEALRMVRVQNGWQRYRRAMQDFDLLPWDIKPAVLDRRAIWPMVFA